MISETKKWRCFGCQGLGDHGLPDMMYCVIETTWDSPPILCPHDGSGLFVNWKEIKEIKDMEKK